MHRTYFACLKILFLQTFLSVGFSDNVTRVDVNSSLVSVNATFTDEIVNGLESEVDVMNDTSTETIVNELESEVDEVNDTSTETIVDEMVSEGYEVNKTSTEEAVNEFESEVDEVNDTSTEEIVKELVSEGDEGNETSKEETVNELESEGDEVNETSTEETVNGLVFGEDEVHETSTEETDNLEEHKSNEGEQQSEESGEQHSEESGEQHSDESGEHHSEDSGEHHSENQSIPTSYFVIVCLILFIDLIREKIEECAASHKFFKTVLMALYSELTTIGILAVSLFLFEKQLFLNHSQKLMFERIHFTISFTAILNAVFSCVLCFGVRQLVLRNWITIEDIDEYELYGMKNDLNEIEELRKSQKFFKLINYFKYSHLRSMIRFNEMSTSFAIQHNLPKGYKVSHYLKCCAMDVLMDTVHIDFILWFTLLGMETFMLIFFPYIDYFTSGNMDYHLVSGIFFVGLGVCLIIVLFLVLFHMRRIYEYIMVQDGYEVQIDLFWMSKPQLLTSLIKYTQMLFALIGARMLVDNIFNVTVDKDYQWWSTLISFINILLFTVLSAYIIPKYTLCTSLGQLVKPRLLNESLAKFHLNGKRKEMEMLRTTESILANEIPITFTSQLRTIFLKRKFFLADIFFTFLCLFCVGRRLEISVLLEEYKTTAFAFLGTNSRRPFITEMILLIFFITVSGLGVAIFYPVRLQKYSFMSYYYASVSDIILSLICLFLLMISEIQRDGDTFEERFMTDSFGKIEPFTALICLRLFRHLWSDFLCHYCLSHESTAPWAKDHGKKSPELQGNIVNLNVSLNQETHSGKVKFLEDENSIEEEEEEEEEEEYDHWEVVYLWKMSAGLFPDIAKKYGIFSTEMLLMMLGIHFHNPEENNDKHTLQILASSIKDSRKPETNSNLVQDDESSSRNNIIPVPLQEGNSGILRNRNYVQEDDRSPKMNINPLQVNNSFEMNRNYVQRNDNPEEIVAVSSPSQLINSSDEYTSNSSSHSLLSQGMRRCEYLLLPNMDNWASVDVVMTSSKITLFDLNVADGNYSKAKMSEIHSDLCYSQGGKGMNLIDVSYGRNILCEIEFSDIIFLKVERHVHRPEFEKKNSPTIVNMQEISDLIDDEYWKSADCFYSSSERNQRLWNGVKNEDHLYIQTTDNRTLYLRFFCDLHAAMFSETLHWCKTIANVVDFAPKKSDNFIEVVNQTSNWSHLETLLMS